MVDSYPLLRRTTCPHCWKVFAPEEVLWISCHADLLGDPRLGPEEQQRFLPTRFDVEGNALDSKGFSCRTLACPHCHLAVPRAILEIEPFFISILGTPASGKSYFLASMVRELRRLLPLNFGLSFADADTLSNRSLNDCEEQLFCNSHSHDLVHLADLIRKTELQGELYDTVSFGNQTVSYPRPFLFSLQLQENHPHFSAAQKLARVLCLYDNAGEHFLTGQDTTSSPVTQHLAQSRMLLFLFDPTQDPRFCKIYEQCQQKILVGSGRSRSTRQEAVLHETADRVRRYAGLSQSEKYKRPLIFVVTKYDAWAPMVDRDNAEEPWLRNEKLGLAGLDRERIEKRSRGIRELLLRACPEVVHAAESFAEDVLYTSVSALGPKPEIHPDLKSLAIRPCDIRPIGVTVPLLYGLCRCLPGSVPSLKRKQSIENSPTTPVAARATLGRGR